MWHPGIYENLVIMDWGLWSLLILFLLAVGYCIGWAARGQHDDPDPQFAERRNESPKKAAARALYPGDEPCSAWPDEF